MYIQEQHWEGTCDRLLIVDVAGCGTVQVDIFQLDAQKDRYKADCLLWALWVDKGNKHRRIRRRGEATVLVQTAELEAKRKGCKSIALEWNEQESPSWVRDWYARLGYEERAFGNRYALMVKYLE